MARKLFSDHFSAALELDDYEKILLLVQEKTETDPNYKPLEEKLYSLIKRVIEPAQKSLSDTIVVCFDGACEPVNPGGTGGVGYLVYEGETLIKAESKVVGRGKFMSNNVAEYIALNMALIWIKDNVGLDRKIEVYGDSKLVVSQMNGEWKIKNGLYVNHARTCQLLLKQFSHIELFWVSRDFNEKADQLSKNALQKAGVVIKQRHGRFPRISKTT